MQTRRILLFFGIVLLLTAAATSFIPVPEEARREEEPMTREPRLEPAPGLLDRSHPEEVEFGPAGRPASETVEPGTRVIVTVFGPDPGQVELQGLGRIDGVEQGTPAQFDLFADERGRFDVVYRPADGDEQRLGTLVVGPTGRERGVGGDGAGPTPDPDDAERSPAT